MLVEVELRAFDDSPNADKPGFKLGYLNEGLRYVNVPNNEVPDENKFHNEESAKWSLLNSVWHWGQNDFQPKSDTRSLMAGDVVRVYGRRFKIDMFGFSEIK